MYSRRRVGRGRGEGRRKEEPRKEEEERGGGKRRRKEEEEKRRGVGRGWSEMKELHSNFFRLA